MIKGKFKELNKKCKVIECSVREVDLEYAVFERGFTTRDDWTKDPRVEVDRGNIEK